MHKQTASLKVAFNIFLSLTAILPLQSLAADAPGAEKPAMSESVRARESQGYVIAVTTKIEKLWVTRTNSISHLHPSKSPFVRLSVMPDGTISKVFISQSSGEVEVDKLAIQTVEESSPMPPLPRTLVNGKEPILMELNLAFAYDTKNNPGEELKAKAITGHARELVSQGKINDATTYLEGQLNVYAKDDFILQQIKALLASFYSTQSEVLSNQDPQSTKALELAEKALKLQPDDTTNSETVERIKKRLQSNPNSTATSSTNSTSKP